MTPNIPALLALAAQAKETWKNGERLKQVELEAFADAVAVLCERVKEMESKYAGVLAGLKDGDDILKRRAERAESRVKELERWIAANHAPPPASRMGERLKAAEDGMRAVLGGVSKMARTPQLWDALNRWQEACGSEADRD